MVGINDAPSHKKGPSVEIAAGETEDTDIVFLAPGLSTTSCQPSRSRSGSSGRASHCSNPLLPSCAVNSLSALFALFRLVLRARRSRHLEIVISEKLSVDDATDPATIVVTEMELIRPLRAF